MAGIRVTEVCDNAGSSPGTENQVLYVSCTEA